MASIVASSDSAAVADAKANGPMRLRTGIRRKLWVVFILQIAAISFATILGVCLIPMLYVATERIIGGAKQPAPAGAPTPPKLATEHGGGH